MTDAAPPLRDQVPRFVAFGLLSSGTHYAIYLLLLAYTGVAPVPATLIGISFGTVLSYGLNSRYTFRRPSSVGSFVRFWTVTAGGAALNASLVALGVAAGLPEAWVGLAAIVVAATFNFVSHRTWTFAAA